MKRELLESFGNYDLNGNIKDSIKKLKDLKTKWEKAGYKDVELEITDEWGYYDEHNIIIKVTGKKEIRNGRDLFKT